MLVRLSALVAPMFLVPGTASAQPRPALAQTPPGFYAAAGIGVNQPQSADVETSGAIRNTLRGNGTVRFEPMAMGVVALGYGFGNGIRVELEGSLRANAVDRASAGPGLAPVTSSQGQLWNWGLMANALVDVDLGAEWIQPYFGVGLGYVWSEVKDFRVASSGQRLAVDGTEGNLAYQAIAGAAFPIAAVPGLSATAEYRFMGTVEQDYAANLFTTTRRRTAPTAGRAEISPYHHAVLFGLRYSLGGVAEPAPATPVAFTPPPIAVQPPIAAAPAVTRSFIVYFGLNSASLTARARQIVIEAAQAARSGSTVIEVGGHTDAAGSPAANQRLSRRRAEAVASELRRQGIAGDSISITAHGETQPAVPTRSGAREPRNRRVEIILR